MTRFVWFIITSCVAFFVFCIPTNAQAAVQYIGSVRSTNSATLPSTVQVGDFIVAFAFRAYSESTGTLPSGWTSINESGSNTNWSRLAFKYATQNGSQSTGTFGSSNQVVFHVYRGVRQDYSSSNLPNFAGANAATSASFVFPAISMRNISGGSYLAWFVAQSKYNTLIGNTVNGMTRRTAGYSSGSQPSSAASFDSNGSTADGASKTTSTSVSGAYRTYTLEIEPPVTVPQVTFSASSSTVPMGGSTVLSWSAANATQCVASGSWSGDKATSGAETVGPITLAQTYVLNCSNSAGTTTKTVIVAPGITVDTASLTNAGYRIYAYGVSGATSTISTRTTNPIGFGVVGASSGDDAELGNNGTASEKLVVWFDSAVASATVQFAWVGPGNEHARYTLYDASGAIVGQGETAGTNDDIEPPLALVSSKPFTRIEFTAPGYEDDYLINNIVYTTYVVPPPAISSVVSVGTNAGREYASGDTDGIIMLVGTSFGTDIGTIAFSGSWGTTTAEIQSTATGPCTVGGWTDTSVCVRVPGGIPDNTYTAKITLTRADDKTAIAPTFTILPRIGSITPTSVQAGDIITITGDHLCTALGCPTTLSMLNNVYFGTVGAVELVSWTNNEIKVKVPSGAAVGTASVSLNIDGNTSNTLPITILSTVPNTPDIGQGTVGGQYMPSGEAVAVGGTATESTITFKAALSAQVPASLMLEVEVKPVGTTFDGSGTVTGQAVTYPGSGMITGEVSSSLQDGVSYHWRVRTRNATTGEVSGWVAYGTNPSGDGSGDGLPANADIAIVSSAPTILGIGTPPNCLAHSRVGDTNARISWTVDTKANLNTVKNYVLISTSTNLTDARERVANDGGYPQVDVADLIPSTTYYYKVRSVDMYGHETVTPTSTPYCQFVTEDIAKRINKLSEYYICQAKEPNEVWYGGSGVSCESSTDGEKIFNVFVSEMTERHPVVQLSAFVEVFGVSDSSSDFVVNVSVNGGETRSHTIKNPNGSISWRVLYPVSGGFNLDYPADVTKENTLSVKVEGANMTSSMGAKAVLNYYYFPTSE